MGRNGYSMYLVKKLWFKHSSRPVPKVGGLLDALQNYSEGNCFKNSLTKVILCLKA
jgi:hypothetical protein